MPNIRQPRAGSMQYWPRKRSVRPYIRIRSWAGKKAEKGLLGFAGYKTGMTHVMVTDNRKNSPTKGQDIMRPVTVVECPPLKIASVRLYKKHGYGIAVANEIITKLDKDAGRKLRLPKKTKEAELDKIHPDEYMDIRVMVYTQPKLTGRGNKKPEVFEMGLAGTLQEKFQFAKENLGKEIPVDAVLKEGQQIDIHAVTKGKGFQGPVKRFGVAIRQHKSEKVIRGPGSLGGWRGQAHVMYRVAHAGQTGYHSRCELNKKIIKIGKDPKEINPKSGFHKYGIIQNSYLLLDGSIPGATKRIVRMTFASRKNRRILPEVMPITSMAIQTQ